jgi:predicted dehydrogenase
VSVEAREKLRQPAVGARPRIGFLGVGWIGRHRLEALASSGLVEIAGIADANAEAAKAAANDGTAVVRSLEDLLLLELDGIAIATPSALHAAQAIQTLERGLAVFCQKPLGRNEAEVRAVVEAARRFNRLLAVDLSYRFTHAMGQIRNLIAAGELGRIFAADLFFHNAYGPDKPWFYDPRLSGGGCLMDLGIHLVDLALWMLDFPAVANVSGALMAGGRPLLRDAAGAEDFGCATITLASGAVIRLTCSWRLHAGQDAVISAAFYGTEGGAEMRNLNGSFYDFAAERFRGTRRETIATAPDAWGGRAAVHWAHRLAQSRNFDPAAEELVTVAQVLDRIYRHSSK